MSQPSPDMQKRGRMDIDGFLKKIAAHDITTATVLTYRKRVAHLAAWLIFHNGDIQNMGERDIQSYCDQHNWSNSTRNQIAAVVRLYARVMLSRSHPLCRLRVKPVPPRIKNYLIAEQIKLLLNACSGQDLRERRTKAAVSLMIDSGLYPGEICSILFDQINLDAMEVRIPGKPTFGTAWFSAFTGECILAWLDVRPNSQSKNLFVGSPQMSNNHPLTTLGLRVIINDVGQRAGIDVSPYTLRATFIRMLSEKGLGAEGVQWAARRANDLFSGNPLTPALVDEIRAALPLADW